MVFAEKYEGFWIAKALEGEGGGEKCSIFIFA